MNTTRSSILVAEVPGYTELQREMHDALRAQHPEWIEADGNSPTCDSYESRLAELLIVSLAIERAFEHDKASNVLRRSWPSADRDRDVSGKVSMPAEYAEARNIVFPERPRAIR
jgi:hypothetical protein